MVGRSVENEIEIRADIKTRALLSRGSTDIYADICTVYVSYTMSFSTVCRQVRDFSAGIGFVTSAPKYCRSKSASSPKIVIKRYTSQQIADMVGISKAFALRFWRNILKMKKESTCWAPHLLNEEQKYTHVSTARKLFKRFPRYDQKLFMNVVTYDDSWVHYFEPHRKISNRVWLTKMQEVSKGAKIRNRYNQVPHLTQDTCTNGKVRNSQ